MPRNTLEQTIEKAAADFALQVVAAIKSSSLQELMALQAGGAPAKPGRKPGRPAKKKPGRKPGRPAKKAGRKPGRSATKKPGRKPGRAAGKPGRKPKAAKAAKAPAAAKTKKKRVVKNYPKCAFPSCGKNRFVRGKGFCGEHFKQFQDGKIQDAASYK
jgi:hypothetical protein